MTHNAMSGAFAGPVVQAGTIHGDITFCQPSLPKPRQLPSGPRFWVNADQPWQQLDQLCRTAPRSPGVAAAAQVVGPGGCGTSALTTRWVHVHRDRYPDGQLVARLAASHRPPPSVGQLLRRFVRDLGVPAAEIPQDLDELTAMFRSVTANRALAIVLDDVAPWMDLEPLIPANPEALLLASARQPVESLLDHGVPVVTLSPLDRVHAGDLLTQMAGCRLPDTVLRHLVAASGGLPASVVYMGIRLRRSASANLTQTVAAVLSEFTTPSARTAMDTPNWINALTPINPTPEQQRLARAAERVLLLLALLPTGSEFDPALAQALTDAVPGGCQGVVEALLDVGLLTRAADTPSGGQKLSMPDVVDAWARTQLGPPDRNGSDITWQGKQAALRAICDWHWIRAHAAERLITGYRSLLPYDCTQPAPPGLVGDRRAALDWLDEHRDMLAALATSAYEYGLYETCLHLVDVFWPLFLHRGHYDLRGRMDVLGVKAAQAWIAVAARAPSSSTTLVDIVRFLAKMLKRLGRGWTRHGREESLDVLRFSRRLYRALDDPKGVAGTCEAIANYYFKTGHYPRALRWFTDVLDRNLHLGRERQVALTHLNLGDTHLALASEPHDDARPGNHDDGQPGGTGTDHLTKADEHLQASHAAFAALSPPDHYNAARVRKSLGHLHLLRGQATDAAAELGAALKEFTVLNSRPEAIRTLRTLAGIARQQGDSQLEFAQLTAAQELHTLYGKPEDREIADRLAELADAG